MTTASTPRTAPAEVRPDDVRTVPVGRARVRAVTLEQAADEVARLASARASALVVTPNIQHVSLLEHDDAFASVYASTPYQYADGWPVVRAATRIAGHPVHRVTGYELLPATLQRAARDRTPTAFVGGRPGTQAVVAEEATRKHPGLLVVHAEAERYDLDDDSVAALADRLRISGARLVVLGLGPPKQELVAARLVEAGCGVVLCIGSALEVLAGTNHRAPVAMQRLHVEWLYRIAREPRRLLLRYLRTFPHFRKVVRRQLAG